MADQWASQGGAASPSEAERRRDRREDQHAAEEAEAREAVPSEVEESEEEEEEEEEGRLRGGVVDANDDYFRGTRELDVEERRAEEEGEKLIDDENAEDIVFGLQDDIREKEAFLAAGLDADAFDPALINDAALEEIDEDLEEKARRAAERHLAARDREARRKSGKSKSYTRDIWAQLLEDDEEGASEMDRVLERVQQRQQRYFGAAGGGRGGADQINLQDFTEAKKLLSESNPALTAFGEQQQQAVDTLFRYFLYHFSLHAFKKSQGGSMLALGEEEQEMETAAPGRRRTAAQRAEEEEGALYYLDRIRDMIRQDRCSLLVDTRHLLFFSEQLIRWLEAHPASVLQVLGDAVAAEAQAAAPSLYSTCTCSVVLTEWPYREELRSLRCSHLNTLIYVSGVVTRRSAVLPKMKLLYLKCANCLASLSDVPIPLVEGAKNNSIPRKCLYCQSSRFVLDRVKTQYVDYQKLVLQETPSTVPAGRVPRQREVLLQGELVDAVRPGEEVEVLGVYQMSVNMSSTIGLNIRCGFPVLSTYILANNIIRRTDTRLKDISDEDVHLIKQYSKHPFIREKIIASIAPALWGNKEVKTAIAYALFGGVPKGRSPTAAAAGSGTHTSSIGGGSSGPMGTTISSSTSSSSAASAAAAAGGGAAGAAAAAGGAAAAGATAGGNAATAAAAGAGSGQMTAGANAAGAGGPGAASGHHVIRGDINVLLLGDPGLGKSQALQYVARTFPRTVSTTGKGASAVGLTAGVRKDTQTGEWTLEGGALVLADEGICLIDEFDKMGERDRVSIHEAMEQQSISISKAGIVTTLRARCSVVAAANPKFGRYIPSYTFKENVDLSDPILSRFDLVAVLRDVPDADEDHFLAEYVLTNHQLSHPNITHLENYQQRMEELERIMVGNQAYEPLPQDLLQKYIIYARAHCHPVLDPSLPALSAKISNFYARLRKRASATGGLPLTLRHVEAVLRIAEANAKMRLSPVVSSADVDYAIASLLDSFISSQKFSVQQRLSREFARYRALARGGGPTLAALLRRLMQQRLQRLLLLRPAGSSGRDAGGIGMEAAAGLQPSDFEQARRINLSDFLKVAHQNKFAAYQVESWMASSHFSDQFRLLRDGEEHVIVSLNWHREAAAAAAVAPSDASTDAGASQQPQQQQEV